MDQAILNSWPEFVKNDFNDAVNIDSRLFLLCKLIHGNICSQIMFVASAHR